MKFFKHHLGDYDSATGHLSWDEDMAYTRLLRAYFRREQPIPDADKYRLCKATGKAQRAAVDAILGEFFRLQSDGWHNKRADKELATYQAQASTNRRIARERTDQRTVHDSPQDRSPNHKPLTINHDQNLKTDLEVSISPTREPANVKSVLKKIPLETNPEDVEKNRRIANATASGNLELAKQIRDGTA